jgi:hypothetical protein
MADLNDRITHGILGDINPPRPAKPQTTGERHEDEDAELENNESMVGGSQQDRTKHSGSRDVTEGTTSGVETGGTRNYRSGGGAVGGDIGNRPE